MTPQTKDDVLSYLYTRCQDGGFYQIDTRDIQTCFHLTFDELRSLLEEFQAIGLIEDLNMRHSATFLCLTYRARVQLEHGGFSRQASVEQLAYDNLRLQYQALQSELEQLKTTNPTLAERILACMSDIAAIAGFVF